VQWAALLYAPVLTYLLFAIDDIGEQFDVPFVAMPLAQMCDRITRDCQEVVSQAELTREMAEQVGADSAEGAYAWVVVDAAEAVALEVAFGEERLVMAAAQDGDAASSEPPPFVGWQDPPGPRSGAGASTTRSSIFGGEGSAADFGAVRGSWSGGADGDDGAMPTSAQAGASSAVRGEDGGAGSAEQSATTTVVAVSPVSAAAVVNSSSFPPQPSSSLAAANNNTTATRIT
jgi:hypothetical protein